MRPFRIVAATVRALLRRDVVAGEIREELDFHLQSRVEHFERQGLSRDEARRAARQRVGNLAVHQDRGYDVRGGGLMETIWQDVRYAVRLLRKQPGFTLVAVLTLALGIGASTAIFSVIDAALLRPLPYPDPEQLVEVKIATQRPGWPEPSSLGPSLADVRQFQRADSPLSAIAIWDRLTYGRIVEGPEPERVDGIEISESYLAAYGLAPVAGRPFSAADFREGAPRVVMLGYGYWQGRYAGDRNVIGRVVRFDGEPAAIVGVMPPQADVAPVWLPLRVTPSLDRRGYGRNTVARLRPGVSREHAEVQLSAMVQDEPGPTGTTASVELSSLLDDATGPYRTTLTVIGGAVGLILLIACVNVAGLLLARGATRQAELAVRASIGAGRGRLVRQLLAESLVLAAAGGALGVIVAWISIDALVANIPMSLPSNAPVTLNLKVLAASVALIVLTGVLFGLMPAFRLSRVQIGTALARGGRRRGSGLSRRGSQLLIATEIALAVVLVAGAGLMIRSFARVLSVDIGFDPDAFLTVEVAPIQQTAAVQEQFYPALLQALGNVPGVASAGAVDHLPLTGVWTITSASVDGRSVSVGIRQFLPGYFETLGIPLQAGRWMTPADYSSALPVVIVNETAAREMFPDGNVVGRQIIVSGSLTVIGVAGDIRSNGPFGREASEVFVPFRASASSLRRALALTVVVRPTGENRDLPNQLRRAAASVGPRVLVERIRTGGDWLGDRVITPRRRTVLLGLLGGLGLVLAAVGVFGMTAYAVSRRTQEIGVRMAFGARPGVVVRQMLRDSAMPIAIGTIVGLGGAALATRLIASFLFQTDPIEPVTFAAVAALLMATGCLAAWIPARRAARVDPVLALRTE